jgi:hypothetical protein
LAGGNTSRPAGGSTSMPAGGGSSSTTISHPNRSRMAWRSALECSSLKAPSSQTACILFENIINVHAWEIRCNPLTKLKALGCSSRSGGSKWPISS